MDASRAALAAFFVAAGANHFANPRAYEAIVPPALGSRRKEVNLASGAAEIAGAGGPELGDAPGGPLVAAGAVGRGLPGQRPHGG